MRKLRTVISVALTIALLAAMLPVGTVAALEANGLEIGGQGIIQQLGETIAGTASYGTGGKFLAPIDPPAEGSIPISNRAELEAIKDDLDGNYHLTADIDLS
ncbi:MAG: hypothetical protein LBU58_05370, partial [Clostridiales bacterium]|nr:hypothetical protein [Clostridiales bacterium]